MQTIIIQHLKDVTVGKLSKSSKPGEQNCIWCASQREHYTDSCQNISYTSIHEKHKTLKNFKLHGTKLHDMVTDETYILLASQPVRPGENLSCIRTASSEAGGEMEELRRVCSTRVNADVFGASHWDSWLWRITILNTRLTSKLS